MCFSTRHVRRVHSPRRERGGNGEEKGKMCFLHTRFTVSRLLIGRRAKERSERGRPPRELARRSLASGAASRATPRETSRDCYLEFHLSRAAAFFIPPRGDLAQQGCDLQNVHFENDFPAPVRAARTRRDDGAISKKFRAQEAPRSELFVFPSCYPPCLLTFFISSFSQRCVEAPLPEIF